jgi:arylsulfatase A-like enzyme
MSAAAVPPAVNVVLVIIDTLRYDHVGVNHGPATPGDRVETPTMDRLADRAWNFHASFAASYPTIAHRTDVMTGRYGAPFHQWSPLDMDVPTLPEALADAGYMTQFLHDTPHLVNGGNRFDHPFHAWTQIRGAEVDRPSFSDSWELLDNWEFHPAYDEYMDRDVTEVLTTDHALPRYSQANRDRTEEADWNAARLFETAAEFVRDNADREEFFLWVDCFDPHEPWDAPPEYVERYHDRGTIDPREFLGPVRDDPDLPADLHEHLLACYKAKVSLVDRWLGELLDALEDTGRREDTAVVLVGDHGTNLDDRPDAVFGKTQPPKQTEAHVPLLVDVPGDDGGDCGAVAQPQDLFATIANIAGADVPDVESHDLLAAAREGTDPRDLALTGHSVDTWEEAGPETMLFNVTDGEWSLAVTPDPAAAELSRLGDPSPVENARERERLHERGREELARRGLDADLAAWLDEGGTGPLPEEYRVSDGHGRPPGYEMYWDKWFR